VEDVMILLTGWQENPGDDTGLDNSLKGIVLVLERIFAD
jgi:hypothetical protein